ncbi:MAG: N-acetyltransferase [Candidatus Paceibacterota bacterium]
MEKVVIRKPEIKDLDSMLEMINSVVEEKAMISIQEKQTKANEKKFLKNTIKNNELKLAIAKVLEIDKKIVGICSIAPEAGIESHIGEVGIFLKKEARGKGLGKKLFIDVTESGIKMFKFKILKLFVFSKNKPAISLYKGQGFKKLGTIKKGVRYYNRYEDDDIMIKYL